MAMKKTVSVHREYGMKGLRRGCVLIAVSAWLHRDEVPVSSAQLSKKNVTDSGKLREV